jgi:hypothetical protein
MIWGKRCMSEIELFDVVALMEDLPEEGLCRGQVGAVVETYPDDGFEVEFVTPRGQTYALLALRADQLMRLHHEPVRELEQAA